jgi:hypothetical protein
MNARSSSKGALEMLSLPPRIRQWESLNELPSLRCLCLSEVDFSEPFLSIYGRSDAGKSVNRRGGVQAEIPFRVKREKHTTGSTSETIS